VGRKAVRGSKSQVSQLALRARLSNLECIDPN
jgi:hypothetical protein